MSPERWRQIERLFHSALAWDPTERAARLRDACQKDDELHKEVESLLAAEQKQLSMVDRRVTENAAERLAPGSQFGCYRIEGLLGEGGMGCVYRARDMTLGREVAVKVLTQAMTGDPDYLRRFEEEARLASSLNHPNIVTIYAVGKESGVAYMAMELVRGRTLAELLTEGPMAVPRVLDLAVLLAEALAAAHRSGIIHRDLKPANIMVTADDEVKVLDFGLAKRHPSMKSSADLKTRTFLTGAGVILGTVGYMSPEQAAGSEVDYASDQFSFGTILYEMLSQQRAFKRETAVETLAAILREQPAPLNGLNPAVSAPLQHLVERCMAKKPAGRFTDTAELVSALRDVRNGAAPAPRRRWTRREALAAGGAAAVSGLAFPAWKFWPAGSGIHTLAVLPFENTALDPDMDFLCEGLTDGLIRQISGVAALTVRPRGAVSVFKGTAVDPQIAGRRLGVDAVVRGSLVRQAKKLSARAELVEVKTGAVLWTAPFERDDADLLAIQGQIATAIVNQGIRLKLSPDDRDQLVRHSSNDHEAYEKYLRALYHQDRETEEDYLMARQLLLEAIERDPNFALAYGMLASNYSIMAVDGYARPSESWPLVSANAKRALLLDPGLLPPHLELGSEAFFNQWNWALAEKEYRIGSNASGGQISEVLGGYELERWAVGRPDDALRLIRRAREVDLVSPSWMLKEADMLLRMGRTEEAASIYDAVISDAADDDRAYFGLAEVRGTQRRFDEAILLLGKGYKAAGEDDPRLQDLLLQARGEKGYEQVQERGAQMEIDNLTARAATKAYVSPLDFARAYSRLGRAEDAFKYLEEAFVDHAPGLVFLKVDRAWDRIRNNPRFLNAVKQVALP